VKSGLIAVGASIAVHAVVVGVIATRPVEEKQVVSSPSREPISFSVTSIPAPTEPSPEPPPPRARRPSSLSPAGEKADPIVDAAPSAEPAAQQTGSPGTEGASSALDSAPEERGDSRGGSADQGGEETPSAPSGPDVNALVHARLAAVADRCYPAAARRFQQRGTVQLGFCADANGAATNTAITQSSGAPLLDGAATSCVLSAAAPFPAEAAGRCFTVPVRFGAK
jgi:periplasmic protein TonB